MGLFGPGFQNLLALRALEACSADTSLLHVLPHELLQRLVRGFNDVLTTSHAKHPHTPVAERGVLLSVVDVGCDSAATTLMLHLVQLFQNDAGGFLVRLDGAAVGTLVFGELPTPETQVAEQLVAG